MQKRNYGQFFALLKQLQAIAPDLDREDIIYDFTAGRTKSLKELGQLEYNDLLIKMKMQGNQHYSPGQHMRRKIIAMFHDMGYKKSGSQGTIDMVRVNEWCVKLGYLKKPLNDHSVIELTKLVTQAKYVHQDYIKQISKCLD